MFAVADAVVSAFSLITLCYVIYSTRKAFKKHHLNIFSHLILILIVASLISKLFQINLSIISLTFVFCMNSEKFILSDTS